MKKLILFIVFLVCLSCVKSQINKEMRKGLKFNYKSIRYQDKVSNNEIVENKTDSITTFSFYFKAYGCPEYLGGYFQKNDTLYLCYQNMNPRSSKLKCVDYYKFTYKIENEYLNYKHVQAKVLK